MDRTWKPTTAGILTIITGAMGIAGGTLAILASKLVGALGGVEWSLWMEKWGEEWWGPGTANIPEMMSKVMGLSSTIILIVGIVVLVFGIIALCGGISAIKRRRWGLSLAGSILSLPINPVLGILAIIFVALGKKDFD